MGLFADDLTAFVRDDRSLINFVELVREFGKLFGLQVNFKKIGNNAVGEQKFCICGLK